MSSFTHIQGYIKYLSIIDRENHPVIMLNFSKETLEIDYQMMIFSSLDLLEYKELQKRGQKTGDEYVGLLMPFYEYEYDVGSYGFLSKNGFKFIILKKIEEIIQETSSNLRLKEVFNEIQLRLNRLLLNPFFKKSDIILNENENENENEMKTKFKEDVIEIIKNKQII